jgi:purine-binding chemotaxis protein CheW
MERQMAGSRKIQEIQEEVARRAECPETGPEEGRTVLVFYLADERYAFPLEVVREVSRVGHITPLPGLPAAVLGATGLRGQVLPVLDLRRLLGLPEGPLTPESRLLIVQHEDVTAAMLADRVEDIAVLPVEAWQAPPAGAEGIAPFLLAIARQGEQTTRLLHLAGLLEAVRHG